MRGFKRSDGSSDMQPLSLSLSMCFWDHKTLIGSFVLHDGEDIDTDMRAGTVVNVAETSE